MAELAARTGGRAARVSLICGALCAAGAAESRGFLQVNATLQQQALTNETMGVSIAASSASSALAMAPHCDHVNVGTPNCGVAKCESEYIVEGDRRILRPTTSTCSFVTFQTGVSLQDVLQLDADVWISPNICTPLDNIAFWFFQTAPTGNALDSPASHWDALSEVDLMETYIGPGAVNSVNTNFAATGIHRQWRGYTITGGVHQHVTMWQDTENSANCPATRTWGFLNAGRRIAYGRALPVVSLYVAHCAPGAPCCEGAGCKALQTHPDTASACITVKDAPILMALSNWGSGHRVTPGCEVGVSGVSMRTK